MRLEPVRHDLAQRTLGIGFIVGLLALCLWILRPFLPAPLIIPVPTEVGR